MKRLPFTLARVSALWCALSVTFLNALAQTPPPPAAGKTQAPANELDVFMAKVLARREVNRKTLDQYILDETESFEILGPGRSPLYRTKRDYTWYVRDGMHVRSPLRFNGVTVGDQARERYETRWISRERARREREAKKQDGKADGKEEKEEKDSEVSIGPDGVQVSVGGNPMPTEPRFVSEAYFMDFKFEPGNYYLAGREQLEGHEVLRIEYYPTKMFGDSDDDKRGRPAQEESKAQPAPKPDPKREQRQRRNKEIENDIERRMNKTALVTLWVDPTEHQIVKYTFDNVWLDFLPAGWLVKIDDLRASMTMGQPFPGVWLPRELNIHSGITLANGSFEGSYERRFAEYRLAEVSTKMRVPKKDDEPEETGHGPFVRGGDADAKPTAAATDAIAAQPPQEVIGEIRIHGNAFLTDKEVLDFAGVAVGQPLPADGIEAITKRLKASDRFETVDVRKRYRSLTNTSDVALVLVVHEKPGVRSSVGGVSVPGVPGTVGKVARPVGWLRSKLMFLPIVSYADGYGFTYGGRVSTVDLLGIGERLSVPLTWGGTRRAAVEFERAFKTGPLTRIESSFGIWNRENPRFEIRDQRVEVKGRAERVFADVFRAGVDASRSTISFGILDDDLWTIGTSAGIDTRLDPSFPGNAIFVTGGWTAMHFRTLPDRVNRYVGDARGYLRVFRQIVLAGRAIYTGTDASLPPYERLLLGGSSSLRGFDTGAFAGDRTFSSSAEVRVPITSVLNGAKLGMTIFTDAGKAWDFGGSMDQAEWHRGVGGGLFLIASIVRINLDIAHGLKTGDTKVHLSSGFTF